MLCRVVLLRSHGCWVSRSVAVSSPMFTGVLDYRRAKVEHYGRSMQARLLHIKDLQKDVLPPLQFARVLTIKEGGVMIHGEEIHFRAAKSKPQHVVQTWWCVTEEEVGFEALARMDARSSTGFRANDDDPDC